jgi:hypothetical protein
MARSPKNVKPAKKKEEAVEERDHSPHQSYHQ